MTVKRALLLMTAGIVMFALWAGTTTFGGISWRNLLMAPLNRSTSPLSCFNKCNTKRRAVWKDIRGHVTVWLP